MTFSRRHTVNPSVFMLGERIDGFRSMMVSSIGSTVSIVATIEPGIWPVRVDANEFELALVNLTLNARDAMPSGGTISITAENVMLSGSETPAQVEGEFVALRISDTGTGIAPDLLTRVFDPFFTTKPAERGSGLGLSQVYGFAHQSGGTVTIDSELGKGTMVTLYLPRGQEIIGQSEDQTVTDHVSDGLVLVVEDNPEVAEVSASMLEQLGYQVQTVRDAAGALEAVDRQKFDLVISDIIMAGALDGLGMARAIRERQPELPVLLVTGYSHMANEASEEFIVMRKPFKLAELSRTTSRMIAESKQPPETNVVPLQNARRGATLRAETK